MKIMPCKFCGDPIFFSTSNSTGKVSPIDASPKVGGNVLLGDDDGGSTYTVLTGEPLQNAIDRGDKTLHWNHFATCEYILAKRAAKNQK